MARHRRHGHGVPHADGLPHLGNRHRHQLAARLHSQSVAIQPTTVSIARVAYMQVMVYGMGGIINLGSDSPPNQSRRSRQHY